MKKLVTVSLFLLPLITATASQAGGGMPSCHSVYQEIEQQLPGAGARPSSSHALRS